MTTAEKLVKFLESSGFKVSKFYDDTIYFVPCKTATQLQNELDNLQLLLSEAGLTKFVLQSTTKSTKGFALGGSSHRTYTFEYSITNFEDFSKLNVFKLSINLDFYVAGPEVTEKHLKVPETPKDMFELIQKSGGFNKILHDWNLLDFITTAPTSGVVEKI